MHLPHDPMRSGRSVYPLRRTVGAGVLALVVTVAGCAGPGGSGSDSEPAIGSVPTVSDAAALRLPLDAYLISVPEAGRLVRAQGVLATECMRRFGFDYRPSDTQAGPTPPSGNARRYGVTDAAVAATHGYGLPVSQPGGAAERGSTEHDPAEVAVLLGRGQQSYEGQSIPQDGCLGEARRTLTAAGPDTAESHLAERLSAESFDRSRQDSRVRAVQAKWSTCMKAQGYDYRGPLDPPADPLLGQGTTEKAIRTALADIRCKTESNLVGVWFTVESAYQERLVEQHHEALEAIRQANVAQLRQAADVLGR